MKTPESLRALLDDAALNPLNPKDLLQTFGLFGVWVIMFAETGLMVGFFLPGDSLLFLAGAAASPVAEDFGVTPIPIVGLLIGAPICAIVGAQLGHLLGERYGRKLFDRPDSRFFKKQYVAKAEYYFDKFGPAKAIVLARFIPIVRTFANPVAGVLEMPARRFFVWNVIGGVLWTDGILLIGYLLASKLRDWMGADEAAHVDRYILPAVAVIIFVSGIPIYIELWRAWRERRQARRSGGDNADTARRNAGDSDGESVSSAVD